MSPADSANAIAIVALVFSLAACGYTASQARTAKRMMKLEHEASFGGWVELGEIYPPTMGRLPEPPVKHYVVKNAGRGTAYNLVVKHTKTGDEFSVGEAKEGQQATIRTPVSKTAKFHLKWITVDGKRRRQKFTITDRT